MRQRGNPLPFPGVEVCQTKASSEVSGSDARSAARRGLRLAISVTATITTAVRVTLTMYCHMAKIGVRRSSSAARGTRRVSLTGP